MSEASEKYGWPTIAFADGTEIAQCPHRWNNVLQKHEPADAGDPSSWTLYGGGGSLRDRAALESLIARAHLEFKGDHRYRIIKKLARRVLNELKRKGWEDVIQGEIGAWADGRIQALAEGESCVDNYRVALKGNTAQMRRYRRQQAAGCCGFHDTEEVCPIDGKTYLIGFNFGH